MLRLSMDWVACPPPIAVEPARMSTKRKFGSWNSKITVVSSIFRSDPDREPAMKSGCGVGMRSLFRYTSSCQNTKSLAVNGVPSDHFWPLRSEIVTDLPSSLCFHSRATQGMILVPV